MGEIRGKAVGGRSPRRKVDTVNEGLDIYVGSLTRYLSGNWELVAQTAARELGLTVQVLREHEADEAIRDPADVQHAVRQWRGDWAKELDVLLDWNESPDAEYFTDKPAWDGYAALILWAAYEEQRQLVRPVAAVEAWSEDPAYLACVGQGFRSRYSHLFDVGLWLPGDFNFVFEADFVTGSRMLIGSSRELAWQLEELNRRTLDG